MKPDRRTYRFSPARRRLLTGLAGSVLWGSGLAGWTPHTRSPFSGDDYGYGWFIDTVCGHPVRYARGYGGQLLYIVPDLGLTVVITSDPTRPARSGGYFGALRRLLADGVIPVVESA